MQFNHQQFTARHFNIRDYNHWTGLKNLHQKPHALCRQAFSLELPFFDTWAGEWGSGGLPLVFWEHPCGVVPQVRGPAHQNCLYRKTFHFYFQFIQARQIRPRVKMDFNNRPDNCWESHDLKHSHLQNLFQVEVQLRCCWVQPGLCTNAILHHTSRMVEISSIKVQSDFLFALYYRLGRIN